MAYFIRQHKKNGEEGNFTKMISFEKEAFKADPNVNQQIIEI
jgi:hypothetical protein